MGTRNIDTHENPGGITVNRAESLWFSAIIPMWVFAGGPETGMVCRSE
ncbi:MAG: hypothetical protein Q7R40_12680 [Phaeospirillum sp.]|nr:hypothetical protein [Phaeospirillum sp.]